MVDVALEEVLVLGGEGWEFGCGGERDHGGKVTRGFADASWNQSAGDMTLSAGLYLIWLPRGRVGKRGKVRDSMGRR